MTTNVPARRTPENPDPRFWLGAFLPTAAVLAGSLALVAGWRGRLPAEVAQQWNWSTREVSDVGPLWLIVLSLAAPAAAALTVLAVMKWSGKLAGRGRRLSVALLSGIAVFSAAALPVLLSGQRGLADPWQALDPRLPMGMTAVLSLVCGILAAFAAGSRPLTAADTGGDPAPAPRPAAD